VKIDVKQVPGISYPKPANHARIVERTSPGVGLVQATLERSPRMCQTRLPAAV